MMDRRKIKKVINKRRRRLLSKQSESTTTKKYIKNSLKRCSVIYDSYFMREGFEIYYYEKLYKIKKSYSYINYFLNSFPYD